MTLIITLQICYKWQPFDTIYSFETKKCNNLFTKFASALLNYYYRERTKHCNDINAIILFIAYARLNFRNFLPISKGLELIVASGFLIPHSVEAETPLWLTYIFWYSVILAYLRSVLVFSIFIAIQYCYCTILFRNPLI